MRDESLMAPSRPPWKSQLIVFPHTGYHNDNKPTLKKEIVILKQVAYRGGGSKNLLSSSLHLTSFYFICLHVFNVSRFKLDVESQISNVVSLVTKTVFRWSYNTRFFHFHSGV